MPRVAGTADGDWCNPYHGDTSCAEARPVLCLSGQKLPRPVYAVTAAEALNPATYYEADYYDGWSEGRIRLTEPIVGTKLTSIQQANQLRVAAFGEGYRMAEHHDGKYIDNMDTEKLHDETWPRDGLSSGGWNWRAYGDISAASRFWVYINDQPASCWNPDPLQASRSKQRVVGVVEKMPRAMRMAGPGSLDSQAIKEVVSQNVKQIQQCFERELPSNPQLSGKLEVEWTVAVDGSVRATRQTFSSLESGAMATCVLNEIRTWRFARPPGGEVNVRYPFRFISVSY